MTCLAFTLLLIVLGWIALLHLLNSDSKAGALARLFATGLIEKLVGRREKPAGDGSDGNSASNHPNAPRQG